MSRDLPKWFFYPDRERPPDRVERVAYKVDAFYDELGIVCASPATETLGTSSMPSIPADGSGCRSRACSCLATDSESTTARSCAPFRVLRTRVLTGAGCRIRTDDLLFTREIWGVLRTSENRRKPLPEKSSSLSLVPVVCRRFVVSCGMDVVWEPPREWTGDSKHCSPEGDNRTASRGRSHARRTRFPSQRIRSQIEAVTPDSAQYRFVGVNWDARGMLVRAVPADPTPFSLVRGQNVVRVAEMSLRNHRGDGVVRLHFHNRLRVGLVDR